VIATGDMVRLRRCWEQRGSDAVGLVMDVMAMEWPKGDPLFEGAADIVVLVMWPDGQDDADLPQMVWLRDLELAVPSVQEGAAAV
jgi:hypothetical protein